MSEFKFACPVCGQHITCDSGSSGSPMPCPTCFRNLVVPQAPAPGAPSLVLAASEVQSRSVPVPGSNSVASVPLVPKKMFPWAALALGLVVSLGAVAGFVFRGKLFHPHRKEAWEKSNRQTPVTPPIVTGSGVAAGDTNWTLNLTAARIPETPVAGQLNGQSFAMERATIKGGMLALWRGAKWPPDAGVAVDFSAQPVEDLAGQTVSIEAASTNAPRIILRWPDGQGQPVMQDFHEGYALRLEFGPLADHRLPGKIYLAAPDEGKSYVAGTFTAEILKPSSKKSKPKPKP